MSYEYYTPEIAGIRGIRGIRIQGIDYPLFLIIITSTILLAISSDKSR